MLIIDDFDLKPLRSPQDEGLHDIFSECYERRSTIVTCTNGRQTVPSFI
jgi:hypothetical protein